MRLRILVIQDLQILGSTQYTSIRHLSPAMWTLNNDMAGDELGRSILLQYKEYHRRA